MAKKDKKNNDAKKAAKAAKAAKNAAKGQTKLKKQSKKAGDDIEDDVDIDQLLEQLALEQEQFEAVNVTNIERPTKRVNATLVAAPSPQRKELILFGGETANSQGIVHFHNDLSVYTPSSDTWRRYVSKNAPLPRSSHAMCYHPSGIMVLHGGEFSSPKQSTFHHYSDTWILDVETKEWAKVEEKKGPSGRSGARMAVWKNYVILFGGFKDLGTSTTYLNDFWLFDVMSYKWQQVEFPPTMSRPDPRSGHSFICYDDELFLYGGYTTVKAGKGLQKGKVLTDMWTMKMKSDIKQLRWERKRKQGWQPTPRVGCSMQQYKGRGYVFGGVYDLDETEETLSSEFYNTLLSYNCETNRWFNLKVKSQKKREVVKKEKVNRDKELEDMLNEILKKANLNDDDDDNEEELRATKQEDEEEEEEVKKVYPVKAQLPHERFNALTCIMDDLLYIYGGIWENGEVECNLDSFYSVDVSKMDGITTYWEDLSEIYAANNDSDDEDEDDDEDEEDDDEEEVSDRKLVAEDESEEEEEDIQEVEPAIPDDRPWLPHPKVFESLRNFYIRTGAEFLKWVIDQNRDSRGKDLKTKAFELAESRWWERREAIQLEEEEMEESGVEAIVEKDFSKVTKRR
ncbi:hypothetical protein CANINC_000803 [Pichia inconspicua]|uniref:DUF4110 domain-containing protein n=1 Tax=Pichia inconspicua TaxID=52247 RepID=A0A4T0X5B4_9ASCO|nr:hypothetical protein CANINC_000803 [[Candida] inconspicua]